MIDSGLRSILKSLSWRVTATLTTIIISFIVTGQVTVALTIGFFEFFTKLIIYYVHERFWNKIKFGRKVPPPEYYI